jgi:uncharacterized protein YqeY
MSIENRLMEDLKLAMKAGRKEEVTTLRMIRAQIKNAQIEKGEDLSEEDVAQVLNKAAKVRIEAIEMYQKGNRDDLVAKEHAEYEIIAKYMPEQLNDDEIEKIIQETIMSLQASSEKDIGRVMGAIMPKVKGKADGRIIQQKVRVALTKLSS